MQNKAAANLRQYERYTRRKQAALVLALLVTLTAALLYMGIGSIRLRPAEILQVFFGGGEAKHVTAIRNIRLPRVLAAMLIGAILAASGAVMQCVLRNSLASASTLGVSQGAAFGAALGIIVFGGGMITNSNSNSTVSISNPYIVTLCAFAFGSVSSLVVIAISRLKREMGPGGLILAGTALSAMFSGGSTLLQYFADDTSLGAVVFWTFGNLGNVGWRDLRFLAVIFALCFAFYLYNRWNYNAMEAGYDTAKSLGVNAERLMLLSMAVCSLSAAAAVSFAGIISFVGLIAPHMMRFFVGKDHRYLIPGSAVCGALLLILADAAAKLIAPPVILPIGAIMSFIGGPVFLILLFRGRGGND
ncbi:MAG: iron ABC transporter permease [Candidatus Limivicinus sp.]|nr:iron ABC transporter permease [Candidatus Limivicinus sp.]